MAASQLLLRLPDELHRAIERELDRGRGDIARMIIEGRSLLRRIANAPKREWARWLALQAMAKGLLQETESPPLTDLPPLDYSQTRRIDHRLILRRH